ncbi:MAG TPA: polyphosphate kinase 2 family protein [Tepidisphaeraceae bacterium]|jgi:PPK2 family polyphosphate:nucleotide phosphotransferase|nr:polyphosphate kinase 2 family protein [Tepidisphaeraceae bacterium]
MIDSPYLAEPGKKFKISQHKSDATGDFKHKKDAIPEIKKNLEKLIVLQDRLYAQASQSILIVFQAMDGGGKDGAISHVFSGVNPQGCTVTSFKQPTHIELAHDYLWRIHAATPGKGMIGIFNRSHYESVLVERVKKIAPKEVWSKRYDQINHFEKLLSDEGTTILKFFLNISWEEQKVRMEKRLADPKKNWKFDPEDLKSRQRWPDYMEAYQDAIGNCSTHHAPWYVVPSDHKWFRNWVISDLLVRTLAKMNPKYPPPLKDVEDITVK